LLYVRLFSSVGQQLAADLSSGPNSSPRIANFRVAASGTYYVGVSGWSNNAYDPRVAGSGVNGTTGNYQLNVQRVDGGTTSLSGIESTLGSGTGRYGNVAAANTGQTIGLVGRNLVNGDRVVFMSVDGSGTLGTTVATPASVSLDGTRLEVVVPANATSGMVRLERENVGILLQVVPTLSDVDQGVNDAFHSGGLRLRGTGFVEGGTRINLGSGVLVDYNPSGEYVNVGGFFGQENDGLDLLVPSGAAWGPITVTTWGGTSASFGLTFTSITSVAGSGTPANAGQASANAGQTIRLNGSGFDTSTDVVFLVVDSNGTEFERVVRPLTVAADGTSLEVTVPIDALTAPVRVVGDRNNTQALLQIVPRVESISIVSAGIVRLQGNGFIEGHDSSYIFGQVRIIDAANTSMTIDVFPGFGRANDAVNINMARDSFGLGSQLTVTTRGGTSAPLLLNFMNLGQGDLRDLAFDGTDVWVATLAGELIRTSISTGKPLTRLSLPDGASNGIGLHVATSTLTLNGITVPVGSLLVSNWNATPDRIFAVDPTSGAILSTLQLAENLNPVSLTYSSADGGHLYILPNNRAQVVEISPNNGTVVRRLDVPFTINAGGLAVHPTTGNLWVGSSNTTQVAELRPDGSLVKSIDLKDQSIPTGVLTGLSFDAQGRLLVSTTLGAVFRVNVEVPIVAIRAAFVDVVWRQLDQDDDPLHTWI
jgi:hypothetical protein